MYAAPFVLRHSRTLREQSTVMYAMLLALRHSRNVLAGI